MLPTENEIYIYIYIEREREREGYILYTLAYDGYPMGVTAACTAR